MDKSLRAIEIPGTVVNVGSKEEFMECVDLFTQSGWCWNIHSSQSYDSKLPYLKAGDGFYTVKPYGSTTILTFTEYMDKVREASLQTTPSVIISNSDAIGMIQKMTRAFGEIRNIRIENGDHNRLHSDLGYWNKEGAKFLKEYNQREASENNDAIYYMVMKPYEYDEINHRFLPVGFILTKKGDIYRGGNVDVFSWIVENNLEYFRKVGEGQNLEVESIQNSIVESKLPQEVYVKILEWILTEDAERVGRDWRISFVKFLQSLR